MIRLGANSKITLVFADVQRGFELQCMPRAKMKCKSNAVESGRSFKSQICRAPSGLKGNLY